jgi:hypothetical protein
VSSDKGADKTANKGSGSEYTNGTLVAGWVTQEDGTAAGNARVWIRPSNFLADTAFAGAGPPAPDGFTDTAGFFRLDSVPYGSYTVEVQDQSGHGMVIGDFYADKYITDLGRGVLQPLGSLEGKVMDSSGANAYVQVIGLHRVIKASGDGSFSLPGLPPGTHPLRLLSARAGVGFKQPGQVRILPGAVTNLAPFTLDSAGSEDFATWPHSRKIRVNLAAAGIRETVRDFPLLVRIYNNDIDFSQSDGKDLRFAGPDGSPLSFEIERWEPGSRLAEVWVKLDSIPAGPDPMELTLFWGKRDAPNLSDGKRVFSSFSAVWHMSEAQNAGDSGTFRDATPTAASATGRLQKGNRKANWGYGGLFQGTQHLRATGVEALKPASTVVLSAWVRPTATDADGAEIASMGDNYVLRINPNGSPGFIAFDDANWNGLSGAKVKKWKKCEPAPALNLMDKLWHHVAGVADGETLRLYVDGVEKAAVPFAQKLAYPLGRDFWIGRNGDGDSLHDFTGQIDEVQVSGQARSAAWINLAYENQRSGVPMIEFR